MAKSKLKSALDNEKGRNIKLEKQRKQEKEARKRKDKNKPEEDEEDVDVPGGVPLDEVEVKVNGKSKKPKKDKKSAPAVKPIKAAKEAEWETDGSEDEDDDDDMPERPTLDLSHLEDSESDISSDEEELREAERADDDDDVVAADDDDEDEIAEGEDDEDDIALSDIESLASEDKGDIIPHQRLTINNTAALTAALNRIQLPYSKLAFSEYQSVTTEEPVEIEDVEDDLTRELEFYKQALSAAKDARSRLKKEGTGFSRPADYFAEMVKSDEHMGKIKQKLIDEAAGKKASAEARKQRDLKKFGKQVQTAKMQDRAKEKKDTIEKINLLKRKRAGADITNTHEEDLFDVALEADAKPSGDRRGKGGKDGRPDNKRAKKDEKFGFGGKKRHAKSNDAQSSADGRGFSAKKMKGKVGGGAKRPGKSVRMKKR